MYVLRLNDIQILYEKFSNPDIGTINYNFDVLFQYYISMIVIFLALVVGAIVAFIFRDKVKEEITSLLQENLITRYQDDPDGQSTIDWIQENVSSLLWFGMNQEILKKINEKIWYHRTYRLTPSSWFQNPLKHQNACVKVLIYLAF